MDFEHYLFRGSPFLHPVEQGVVKKIVKSVLDGQDWPQDAIAGEMLIEHTRFFNGLMKYATNEGKKKTIFSWAFKKQPELTFDIEDIIQFLRGYTTPLFAINVAVRGRETNEEQARQYVIHITNGEMRDMREYLLEHLMLFNRRLEFDWTCAELFKYVAENLPKHTEFCQLGIESARMEFAVYSGLILKHMEEVIGPLPTFKLWRPLFKSWA